MMGYKYERTHLTFYDQEMIDADCKRATQRASTRTQTAQHGRAQAGYDTRQAQDLEAQAQREQSLAARVTDPKLKDLIRNSATGKAEAAQALRGTPVAVSQFKKELERSQPYHSKLTTRPK